MRRPPQQTTEERRLSSFNFLFTIIHTSFVSIHLHLHHFALNHLY